MSATGASLRHNLARLLDFGGVESRALFWPYAIAVLVAVVMGWIGATARFMLASFARIAPPSLPPGAARSARPTPEQMDAFMPDMSGIAIVLLVVEAIAAAMLVAAIVRRLRDAGWRPGWVAPAVLLWLAMRGLMIPLFDAMRAAMIADEMPPVGLFGMAFLVQTAAMAMAAFLLFMLVQPSRSGS